MRISVWAGPAIATILAAVPAHAQTYDPAYPVCMQIYRLGGGWIDCSYTSLAQCAASASGRAAMCLTNPFFAHENKKPPKQVDRRQQRGS